MQRKVNFYKSLYLSSYSLLQNIVGMCLKLYGDSDSLLETVFDKIGDAMQSWQTHKGGDMDQEDRQHELRHGELPTEPRMGQALTYRRLPEVSPDEDFCCEIETSTNTVILVV